VCCDLRKQANIWVMPRLLRVPTVYVLPIFGPTDCILIISGRSRILLFNLDFYCTVYHLKFTYTLNQATRQLAKYFYKIITIITFYVKHFRCFLFFYKYIYSLYIISPVLLIGRVS
jgi:hypothetical protein